MRLSLVVPLYNEEQNLVSLVEQVQLVLAAIPEPDYEFLMVNDGSTDGTEAHIEALAASDERIRPVHLAGNQGESAALLAGFAAAHGDFIITLDGDLQNDPASIPSVLELLNTYDCVCGYRLNRRDSLIKRLASWCGNKVSRAMFGAAVRDAGCGLKGFRKECIACIPSFKGVHRFLPIVVAMGGFRIAECATIHHPRVSGKSKYGIMDRLFQYIYDLIGVKWMQSRQLKIRVREDNKA
jgi:dolichol-phosphate mannosyltransferase